MRLLSLEPPKYEVLLEGEFDGQLSIRSIRVDILLHKVKQHIAVVLRLYGGLQSLITDRTTYPSNQRVDIALLYIDLTLTATCYHQAIDVGQ